MLGTWYNVQVSFFIFWTNALGTSIKQPVIIHFLLIIWHLIFVTEKRANYSGPALYKADVPLIPYLFLGLYWVWS
jgi:hypothetical protein